VGSKTLIVRIADWIISNVHAGVHEGTLGTLRR